VNPGGESVSAAIVPHGQPDSDARTVVPLTAPAYTNTVQHVDRDFTVSATGRYDFETWGNDGTLPDPDHLCTLTATITKPQLWSRIAA
jgi:hypothetical protein